ncbi:cyclin-D-binding Myb-like transcription factor 1 isoform X1 [Chiloscyllium plagiosum]|uniref:cyclin-D-binding Myb-like transcription factor 1 isoform X1 n=2 Tax=Chiloscyllium plagiosum TaxID=36176 RepID=UPI001CB7FF3A|nr:cyclin-D-binding Myb-like transcription factor 1 isoform X1 [Chiloscyllium plagiosum]XP_043570131.1 cyclin-D-binding Myb-like transcription factor 1 isoform X1 [Chiloscyllium plagiosum]
MNTIEDESGTVTLETIRAVTIGQDTEGNLILHCPQNDLESEDNQEPLHKRLCLSTEDDASLESTGIAGPFAAVQSVVTLPISDNDQSFEVTMTGEAASELAHATEIEDNETVTQIQVLHNEDHMDGIPPQNNEDLDPVSQAWFTTKEDKDTLQNKGHKWKQGMWSKEEIDILMSNIENYLQIHGLSDATEVIFEMSKDERKDFYRTIARGLNRPLFAVYRRVLRMYDNRNHVGKYTPQEIEKLKELRSKHGNDWATIGAALGRSASSVKDRCRLMKDTCNTGKWTIDEEKRLAEVVHELTATDPGDIVTQGVSWAAVAERVGTRSEKQCRSKWLNYLNWKQSGGTEWSKDDEINLILRIAELNAEDESEINWDIMAEGWSSVRSPQWLRSKWWTIKRQVTNHKDLTFAELVDSLRQLVETLKQPHVPVHQLPECQTGTSSRNSNSSSVQHLRVRLAQMEENNSVLNNPVAALQIPVQITHVASNDSCGSSTDCETITLNAGTLQRFEFLPSFRLQPTGTPGTYLIQTSSSQGLPITLTTSPTVTLTSPSSPEQIIVHTLSPEALLPGTNENVSVQMTQPSVIIHAVATDDITSSITQAELTVDSTIDNTDLTENQINSTSLETDAYSEIDEAKLTEDQSTVQTDLTETEISQSNLNSDNSEDVMGSDVNINESDLRQDVEVQSDLSGTYVTEALGSPTIESGIDEETTLIVSSDHGFIQATDDIDNDLVLPLTTLTDPILQPQGDCSDIIGSSLETPDTDD